MGKKLLIVVDYQKDFVDGSLGFSKAVELENNIYNKIIDYKEHGNEVVFTYDTHPENYLSTQEGRNLPVEHCIKGREGWELYGRIDSLKSSEDIIFEKGTFGSLDLANYLKGKAYDSIELVGLVSNICVISNGILAKSALPEAEIIVDAQCTASFDDSMNEKVLDVMEGLQIRVVNR
ncbi:cysteine hydrolase family protein [Alloiococcus sp. CFN-8]|uniref:cysteine hydrolase family protein n=1 Tax=Alloiococcus sp. CFN-8 TaxID=3416081 RepID=UPI003CEA55FD